MIHVEMYHRKERLSMPVYSFADPHIPFGHIGITDCLINDTGASFGLSLTREVFARPRSVGV
jgi:hypothetical protein